MKVLRPGLPAPNINLQTIDGEWVELAEYWQRAPHTLVIFLRHLG